MSDTDHSPKKVFKCPFPECSSVFQRPSKLDTHLKVHANFRHYVCFVDGCGKAYFTSSHLNRHLKTAHLKQEQNDTVYRCPICFKLFVNRQNLKRHMKRHKEKEYFICEYCQQQFPKKDWLVIHMYRHTGVKAFCCDLCEQQFVTKSELTKHRSRHKTYTCEECQVKFGRLQELQHHRRVDHVKEYICDHCNKKFKTKSLIRLHMKTHYTTEKPFLCPYAYCDKAYSKKSNMKAHYLLKHANMTYDCLMCGSQLTTKASLKNHYLKVHLTPPRPHKQKTLAEGRKVRKDKGIPKSKVLQQISGVQDSNADPPSTITHTESEQKTEIEQPNIKQNNMSDIALTIARKLTERIQQIELSKRVEMARELEAIRTFDAIKDLRTKKLLQSTKVGEHNNMLPGMSIGEQVLPNSSIEERILPNVSVEERILPNMSVKKQILPDVSIVANSHLEIRGSPEMSKTEPCKIINMSKTEETRSIESDGNEINKLENNSVITIENNTERSDTEVNDERSEDISEIDYTDVKIEINRDDMICYS